MGRPGRRRSQLLDDLKETKGNFKLKKEAIHRTLENSLWITCCKTPYITAMADNRSNTILKVSRRSKRIALRNRAFCCSVETLHCTIINSVGTAAPTTACHNTHAMINNNHRTLWWDVFTVQTFADNRTRARIHVYGIHLYFYSYMCVWVCVILHTHTHKHAIVQCMGLL
jgi:hypothetical protein